MIYIASVLVSFISVFLKGFQQKNVIHNRVVAAALTSYLMATFDVLAITIIIHGDLWIILTTGTGAACGIVAAMKLHDRVFQHRK